MADDDTQATLDDLNRRAREATAGVRTQDMGGSPPMQSRFPEQGAQDYLSARREETGRAIGALGDVSARARAVAGQPTGSPAMPQLEKPTPAPQMPYADALQVFQNPAVLLLTLGSLFTRTPATTALRAGAAAMDGYTQGNEEAYQRARQIWKDKTQEMRDRNAVELEKYQAAWKKTEHNARERLAQLHALSIEHQDVVMQHQLAQGDLDAAWSLMQLRQKADEHLDNALLKHDEIQARIEASREGRILGMTPDKLAAQQFIRDWQDKHGGKDPPADELLKFTQSLKTRSLTIQNLEQGRDRALTVIQENVGILDRQLTGEGSQVTGITGGINRVWNAVMDITQLGTVDLDPSRFKQNVEILRATVPRLLNSASRISATERRNIEDIVGGLGVGEGPEQSRHKMEQLYRLLAPIVERETLTKQPDSDGWRDLGNGVRFRTKPKEGE